MALENFLWEFGEEKDREFFDRKKAKKDDLDGMIDYKEMDMLRNVQVFIFGFFNNIFKVPYKHHLGKNR